jgi:hypothetical protein
LGAFERVTDVTQASPAWLEAQKAVIAKRAEARWAALVAGDFAKAYGFESPEYRSVFSIQQFSGRFGGAVTWKLARTKSVEYDPGNVARVVVEVEYDAPIMAHGNVRGVRQMMEKWLFTDGDWWYISN